MEGALHYTVMTDRQARTGGHRVARGETDGIVDTVCVDWSEVQRGGRRWIGWLDGWMNGWMIAWCDAMCGVV